MFDDDAGGLSDPALALELLRRGVARPVPAPTALRAGHVGASLDGIVLRGIGMAGLPLVDRIHVAVRDADWATIPAKVSDVDVATNASGFRVTFTARNQSPDLDFEWQGRFEGSADGSIHCSMSGRARVAFRYCRIGFCLLYPDMLAGAPYEAETPNGVAEGRLPQLVAPQWIVGGAVKAPIPVFTALTLQGPGHERVIMESDGHPFELEDQRNWTDASFKSYSPPIRPGYPYAAEAGQRFEQGLTIRVEPASSGLPPVISAAGPERVLTLGVGRGRGLPSIGLGVASVGGGLWPRAQELLGRLDLDHLRVDVRPSRADWSSRLADAMEQAQALGCGLEVALYVPVDDANAIDHVAAALTDAQVARWLVFDEVVARTGMTSQATATRAREVIGATHPGSTVAGGTDADFVHLNRGRPEFDELDALVYSISPTAHATDDQTVMDNSSAQGVTVETARTFAGGRAICVGPVTLARRFDPNAARVEPALLPGELSPSVDVRQVSLLAAAWTVGSLASLASAGPASVTYYETVGWGGLMERSSGSPLPARFPSLPGAVFPVYHVFAQLARMRGGELLALTVPSERETAALMVRLDDEIVGMEANLTAHDAQLSLGPIRGPVSIRVLDETTATEAGLYPEAFDASAVVADAAGGRLQLPLKPYATVLLHGWMPSA